MKKRSRGQLEEVHSASNRRNDYFNFTSGYPLEDEVSSVTPPSSPPLNAQQQQQQQSSRTSWSSNNPFPHSNIVFTTPDVTYFVDSSHINTSNNNNSNNTTNTQTSAFLPTQNGTSQQQLPNFTHFIAPTPAILPKNRKQDVSSADHRASDFHLSLSGPSTLTAPTSPLNARNTLNLSSSNNNLSVFPSSLHLANGNLNADSMSLLNNAQTMRITSPMLPPLEPLFDEEFTFNGDENGNASASNDEQEYLLLPSRVRTRRLPNASVFPPSHIHHNNQRNFSSQMKDNASDPLAIGPPTLFSPHIATPPRTNITNLILNNSSQSNIPIANEYNIMGETRNSSNTSTSVQSSRIASLIQHFNTGARGGNCLSTAEQSSSMTNNRNLHSSQVGNQPIAHPLNGDLINNNNSNNTHKFQYSPTPIMNLHLKHSGSNSNLPQNSGSHQNSSHFPHFLSLNGHLNSSNRPNHHDSEIGGSVTTKVKGMSRSSSYLNVGGAPSATNQTLNSGNRLFGSPTASPHSFFSNSVLQQNKQNQLNDNSDVYPSNSPRTIVTRKLTASPVSRRLRTRFVLSRSPNGHVDSSSILKTPLSSRYFDSSNDTTISNRDKIVVNDERQKSFFRSNMHVDHPHMQSSSQQRPLSTLRKNDEKDNDEKDKNDQLHNPTITPNFRRSVRRLSTLPAGTKTNLLSAASPNVMVHHQGVLRFSLNLPPHDRHHRSSAVHHWKNGSQISTSSNRKTFSDALTPTRKSTTSENLQKSTTNYHLKTSPSFNAHSNLNALSNAMIEALEAEGLSSSSQHPSSTKLNSSSDGNSLRVMSANRSALTSSRRTDHRLQQSSKQSQQPRNSDYQSILKCEDIALLKASAALDNIQPNSNAPAPPLFSGPSASSCFSRGSRALTMEDISGSHRILSVEFLNDALDVIQHVNVLDIDILFRGHRIPCALEEISGSGWVQTKGTRLRMMREETVWGDNDSKRICRCGKFALCASGPQCKRSVTGMGFFLKRIQSKPSMRLLRAVSKKSKKVRLWYHNFNLEDASDYVKQSWEFHAAEVLHQLESLAS
eukprot:GDKJ01022116.1.p1 GENE.GDKJ01022116.1~~GDKJ01022116.1.p1  ORF type:complete len:1096 (-),score=290.13 GDKJ01022116.1:42-3206(-)